MKKRFLAWLLSATMLFTLIPGQVFAAESGSVALDLGDGSIVITKTGYTQGTAAEETPFTGSYVIKKAYNEITTNTITVSSGEIDMTLADDLNIDVSATSSACAFSVKSGASLTLTLSSNVVMKSGSSCAGLQVPTGASLTIRSTSKYYSLESIGGSYGAGIGGNNSKAGGNITIESGRITAKGGSSAAGIGGGYYGSGTGENETIRISGGTVKATGGSGGAGIGGGCCSSATSSVGTGTGSNGAIIIDENANVTATGGAGGAGIGGGRSYATSSSNYYGHGTGSNGQILITGHAVVTAIGKSSAAGIGGGGYYYVSYSATGGNGTGSDGSITISGNAQVTAKAEGYYSYGSSPVYYYYGSGIGAGAAGRGTGTDGKILITDNACVEAYGNGGSLSSTTSTSYGNNITAGIGGQLGTGTRGKIIIDGNPSVTATGYYAGIGGYYATDDSGAINISGGTVTANATYTSSFARGLGGYNSLSGGAINISGGQITATGSYAMSASNLYGGTVIAAATLSSATSAFSSTPYTNSSSYPWVLSDPGCASLTQGVLFTGTEGVIYGDLFLVKEDFEIPEGYTLTVAESQELVLMPGGSLTINGKLIVHGTVVDEGGDLIYGETCELEGNIVHTHNLISISAKSASCDQAGCLAHWTCSVCGMVFSDANGLKETTLNNVTLPALGHTFENSTCTVCGLEVTEASVLLSTVSGRPGDTVQVSVSLANNPGIINAKMDISFDTSRLKLVSVQDTGLLKEFVASDTFTSPFALTWSDSERREDNTANGVIAYLTFRILDNSTEGTSAVTAAISDMTSTDLGEVPFTVTNGAVNVVNAFLGDANSDGVTNLLDAILMRRYIAHWTGVTIQETAADLDQDGTVGLDDVSILRRYLANWDGYDLPYTPSESVSLQSLASNAPTFKISDAMGQPGDYVTVDVTLENNPGIIGALLLLDYDPSQLKLTDAQDLNILEYAVFGDNYDHMPYLLTWENGGAAQNNTANAKVARLTFEVLPGCDQAELSLSVSEAYNHALQPIAFQTDSGTVYGNTTVSYDEETGKIVVSDLPENVKAVAAAYQEDRMLWFSDLTTNQPLPETADMVKVFFLYDDWTPIGTYQPLPLSN